MVSITMSFSANPLALHLFTAEKISMSQTADPSNHSESKAYTGGKKPATDMEAYRASTILSEVKLLCEKSL